MNVYILGRDTGTGNCCGEYENMELNSSISTSLSDSQHK
jgi:hypothetical protein